MIKGFSNQFSQKGFSLIELMIALVLGLIVTAVAIQIFLATKQTYRLTQSQSEIQDNARIALSILTRDIREAGYGGCKALDQLNVQIIANDPLPAVISENTIITGYEGKETNPASWSPALPDAIKDKVEPETDVITLQKATSCGGTLTGNLTASNANIHINSPNTCRFDQGEAVMVADCNDAHIFRLSNSPNHGSPTETLTFGIDENKANHLCTSYSSSNPGSCDSGTEKLYGYDAEVYIFSAVTYFVGKTHALYLYDNASNNSPVEIVEGIENIQITYGIDDNNDDEIDRYENADKIQADGDWDKVISASVSLLSQTLADNVIVEDQVFNYDNRTVTKADGKLRRVFTTTIAVRNRVQ